MEIGNVTSDKIHYTRQSRATDAEIKALAIDIRDNGLKHPVLVDAHSGLLLDGLNRLRAYQMLGWSVVPARFFDTPSEAADVMQAERDGKLWSYQRAMELFGDVKLLTAQWDVRRRVGKTRPRKGTSLSKQIEGSRSVTTRATGVTENAISRINILVNMAKAGNAEAQKLVENIYASPPGARIMGFDRTSKLHRLEKDMLPMEDEERVRVLADIFRAVETSLEQVSRVGGIHRLPPDANGKLLAQTTEILKKVSKIKNELRRQQSE